MKKIDIIGKNLIVVVDKQLVAGFVVIKVKNKSEHPNVYDCELDGHICKFKIEIDNEDIKVNSNYAFFNQGDALDYADTLLHQNLHILKTNIEFLRTPASGIFNFHLKV